MMARAHIFVHGLVQGVYFRHSTTITAKQLGLSGWVRNLPDGRVEVVCEGPREQILAMIAWCKEGPGSARVDSVEVDWEGYADEFKSFDVRY
jgi:acylphosphatase